ncbi:MAG: hypothetical protein V5B35_01730 [Candidatus Accumulibacter necessarius]|jgi:hypothetical protein|uniref:hypothetical protein n=1 Tax=Candidatus Accumulibacter necessarius TaxID=2954386 RepID=UPI002FC2C695
MSGRGKSQKSMDLIHAAFRIFSEIQPASVRAACYRLFTEGLIPSMAKNHTNAVGTQLVWARENHHLPWDWVVDETRAAERIASWENPETIIRSAIGQYRKDYWKDQPEWVEVWSEKGTVRGTLSPVLKKYGVTFRVMHGYGSATSLHNIAQESARSSKYLTILYIGDWDPSGMNMSEVDLPARMNRYEGDFTIERIALDAGDVGPGTKLPSFAAETKVGDSRHKWFVDRYGQRCWELDALSPVVLRQRVETAILGCLDQDAWDHSVNVEAVERESMTGFMDTWQSISRPAKKYSLDSLEGGAR